MSKTKKSQHSSSKTKTKNEIKILKSSQMNKNDNMVKHESLSHSSEKEIGAPITGELHVTRQEKQRAARLLPLSLLL